MAQWEERRSSLVLPYRSKNDWKRCPNKLYSLSRWDFPESRTLGKMHDHKGWASERMFWMGEDEVSQKYPTYLCAMSPTPPNVSQYLGWQLHPLSSQAQNSSPTFSVSAMKGRAKLGGPRWSHLTSARFLRTIACVVNTELTSSLCTVCRGGCSGERKERHTTKAIDGFWLIYQGEGSFSLGRRTVGCSLSFHSLWDCPCIWTILGDTNDLWAIL